MRQGGHVTLSPNPSDDDAGLPPFFGLGLRPPLLTSTGDSPRGALLHDSSSTDAATMDDVAASMPGTEIGEFQDMLINKFQPQRLPTLHVHVVPLLVAIRNRNQNATLTGVRAFPCSL